MIQKLLSGHLFCKRLTEETLLILWQDNIRLLLDVAAEQPDRELLLQKHFTALLSSVWKVKSRVELTPSCSSSRNGLYRSLTWKSMQEPPEKLKFTNLGESSRMLKFALSDVSLSEDTVSPSNQVCETSSVTEQLEINLEFQKELEDSMVPLPSFISLSISGADPPPSVSKASGEDHHFKASQNVAENRFRYGLM